MIHSLSIFRMHPASLLRGMRLLGTKLFTLSGVRFLTVAITSAKLRSGMTLLFALILILSSLVTSPRVLWSNSAHQKE